MKNFTSFKYRILMVIACCGMIAANLPVKAQSYSTNDPFLERLELGIQPGATIYQGDLPEAKLGKYSKPNIALGLTGSYQFSHWTSVNLQYVFSHVAADESSYGSYHSLRNFKFSTPLHYLQGSVRVFPFASRQKKWWYDNAWSDRKQIISPFVTVGGGLAYFNPKSSWENLDRDALNEERLRSGLAADSIRNHKTFAGFVSAGVGFKIRLAENMYLTPSIEWRRLYSDYLDGFHKSCDPDSDSFTSIMVAYTYYFFRPKQY